MDKALRNKLRNVITQCRKQLEQAISDMLQGQYGIHASGEVEDAARMTHLSAGEQEYRERVVTHLQHIKSSGLKPKDAVAQLVREAAFTHLNRLCAYKMMATRGLIADPVGKVLKSRGFLFYLPDHPEDERLWSGGEQEKAYRHYLEWLNGTLSDEIGVLFSPQDIASGLFPPHRVLESVLELLNSAELQAIWKEDETIGWVYQYFTPKELRDQARKESAAPRNSYEMAFRNQFFTPRYVVEFLTDNTLGRTWYEMRAGDTALRDKCRYLVSEANGEGQTQESAPRRKKDPREIKVLDPACGSGHFLLYCFDLFQTIYEEAYTDEELAPRLRQDFPDAEEFKRAIPSLILAYNLHGIDIDLRVTQLAALALWLRAQRAFQDIGLREKRPRIKRMRLVCAEPMPGEDDLLEEFIAELRPHPLGRLIGELVRNVFARMRLAGEAGALVRIEDDISEPIEEARRAWQEMLRREAEREEELAKKGALFDYRKEEAQQNLVFDIADITSEKVWHDAEAEVVQSLRDYARRAGNGRGLLRRLFAEDAEQGFAFIDLCRQKFDVLLMNPPFGDASIPSKPYIDETYADTKGDVYKAFVECFQDRLVPGGFLGIISSRTGFFLSGSSDWRERIVLRLYRPLVLADFGMGVLDAMVETAAYVLRSLTEEEDHQLTLQLAKDLENIPTDKNALFSTKKYEDTNDLKRHQANSELRRLQDAGFIKPVEGHFPRWSPLHGEIGKAPVPSLAPYPSLVCLRLLGEENKNHALYEALHDSHNPRRFIASPEDFRQVPSTPFCYWVTNNIRRLFKDLPAFESEQRTVRVGLQTNDDFRFLRAWWEVPSEKILDGQNGPKAREDANSFQQWCRRRTYESARWVAFAKGGEYSPYFADLHLLVEWENDGKLIKDCKAEDLRSGKITANNSKCWNQSMYFLPGLTWPKVTISGLSMRPMPGGVIFSIGGPAAFLPNELLDYWLGVSNTQLAESLMRLMGAWHNWEAGTMRRLPFATPTDNELQEISKLVREAVENAEASLSSEVAIRSSEWMSSYRGSSLLEILSNEISRSSQRFLRLKQVMSEIELKVLKIYGLGTATFADESVNLEAEKRYVWEYVEPTKEVIASGLISFSLGCIFGRWDVRFATGDRVMSEMPEPFTPLPVCAPGALTGEDGLPLSEAPEGYPLRVDSDGILVDDSTHADDLLTRVREVFELVWPKAAEAREREACELLGVKDLRDYFRKPAAGGFWADHVKRYSKSRRKAPIYWLLRSSKGSYSIWLYYHRLDKDILFKALLNYVEPKIRLEESTLAQLRTQRTDAGDAGKAAKQIEKQLEKQESLLSEIYDFRDKLQRVAHLHLEPDLNDGVILNIAPLRELVPWSEAKKYWEELLAGKYEWSSISKQLREKGMTKK